MTDIFVLTFNRLPYLEKCIWSILAGTNGKYRIVVLDDGSTDGSKEWLLKMRSRKIGIELIFPKEKLGTARGFNKLCSAGKGEWFAFCNDDMWFHRGWLEACMGIVGDFDDCGMVSFYDYTAVGRNTIKIFPKNDAFKLEATGLGATMMYRPLWDAVGGFHLSGSRVMGFFASNFCNLALHSHIKRSGLYMPIPAYAHNMDLVKSKLSERAALTEYIKFRQKHKIK